MKELLELIKLLYQSSSFVDGKLTFNIEVKVTGSVDIRDPEKNYVLFVSKPETE